MTSFFAQSGHRERPPIRKSVKPVLLITLCTERKEACRGDTRVHYLFSQRFFIFCLGKLDSRFSISVTKEHESYHPIFSDHHLGK